MSILVFGGTTEGRLLARWLDERAADALVCTATEYGSQLIDDCAHVRVRAGRMDARGMVALMASEHADCVVDATHPYAAEVTENVRTAAAQAGVPVLRLVREGEPDGPWMGAADVRRAAELAAQLPGNVLLTCGSKELPTFAETLGDFADRVWARILPTPEAVAAAAALGLPASHLIALQGPFSYELNRALMVDLDIRVVVTKASGRAGGFWEKIHAAEAVGARSIVIHRPNGAEEPGLSLSEVEAELVRRGLAGAATEAVPVPMAARTCMPAAEAAVSADAAGETDDPASRCRVYLIGTGMGAPDLLSARAMRALDESELVIGAKRLLAIRPGAAPTRALVRTDDIVSALRSADVHTASVLFSGDIGFYSGAALLRAALRDDPAFELVGVPGPSSLSYFCARTGISYQNVFVASAHGRACNVVGAVQSHARTFLLTGGSSNAAAICADLVQAGWGDVRVTAGERLSYPDERIVRGTAAALARERFSDTTVLYAENDRPVERPCAAPALPDAAFEHDAAPLTKQEVRALVIAKLQIREADTVWDVGAGSGSVSVEAARAARAGRVFAIERKPAACASIARNAKRHGAGNVTVVEGCAPAALAGLPAPDRVFIGGSAGAFADIVACARAANPEVRIVASAITLETAGNALAALSAAGFRAEAVEVGIARSHEAGPYHLMKAENPVYLFAAEPTGGAQ